MNGRQILAQLKNLCDQLDLRTTAVRTVAIAALPASALFTVACYGAPGMEGDVVYHEEVCLNGLDDDYDGLTDCDDEECARLELCLGCDDGYDNDGNGYADCSDSSCLVIAPCTGEICGDGLDNDLDGAVDCADSDCDDREACQQSFDEWGSPRNPCADGEDNDGNDAVDCADPSCAAGELCQGSYACEDYNDNDLDGLFDCDDPDCWDTGSCW